MCLTVVGGLGQENVFHLNVSQGQTGTLRLAQRQVQKPCSGTCHASGKTLQRLVLNQFLVLPLKLIQEGKMVYHGDWCCRVLSLSKC